MAIAAPKLPAPNKLCPQPCPEHHLLKEPWSVALFERYLASISADFVSSNAVSAAFHISSLIFIRAALCFSTEAINAFLFF